MKQNIQAFKCAKRLIDKQIINDKYQHGKEIEMPRVTVTCNINLRCFIRCTQLYARKGLEWQSRW